MGKHRAPTTTRKTVTRFATVGTLVAFPFALNGNMAFAATPPGADPIVTCESNNNPRAENPTSTASGKYQFLDSTWQALGGTGTHAADASVAEQDRIAAKQIAISGYTAWNASKGCWAGKVGAPSTARHQTTTTAVPRRSTAVPRHTATILVSSGDTLTKLAAINHTSWRVLWQNNRSTIGSNPNIIYPGEHLNV